MDKVKQEGCLIEDHVTVTIRPILGSDDVLFKFVHAWLNRAAHFAWYKFERIVGTYEKLTFEK
jgi:hypothetical protein